MAKAQTKTYQQLSRELDEVMNRLQTEDIDVDEALALYKQGTALTKQLEDYLQQAENTLKKLPKSPVDA
jgi:exodeoxyribonuclease VII small subunit